MLGCLARTTCGSPAKPPFGLAAEEDKLLTNTEEWILSPPRVRTKLLPRLHRDTPHCRSTTPKPKYVTAGQHTHRLLDGALKTL